MGILPEKSFRTKGCDGSGRRVGTAPFCEARHREDARVGSDKDHSLIKDILYFVSCGSSTLAQVSRLSLSERVGGLKQGKAHAGEVAVTRDLYLV